MHLIFGSISIKIFAKNEKNQEFYGKTMFKNYMRLHNISD